MKTLKKMVVASALTLSTGSVFAAVPVAVTDAITGAVTDVGTIGAAVLIVAITIATFIWLRKPMH